MCAESERHLDAVGEQLRKNGGGAYGEQAATRVQDVNDCGNAKGQAGDGGEIDLVETAGSFQRTDEDQQRQSEALDEAGKEEKRSKRPEDVTVNGEEVGNRIDRKMGGENDQEAGSEVIVEG